MVDENESYEAHEEGEYHFSDEQINYEAPTDAPVKPESSSKKLLAKLGPYKRPLIGLVVFFVLIYIVFKMLTPTSTVTPPTTEFNPNTVSKPIGPPKSAKPLVPAQPTTSLAAPGAIPEPTPQTPMSSFQGQAPQTAAAVAPAPASMQPSMPPPTEQVPPQTAPPVGTGEMMASQMAPAQPPGPSAPPISAPPTPPANMTMTSPMVSPPPGVAQAPDSMMQARVAALEEQNAKVMGLLETQVAQKIADYQIENTALKERIVILNKRLANIEASLNKMAQLLQDQGPAKTQVTMMPPPGFPPARIQAPKMIYTVQAIIPGRAWLKSDTGETVTVTEGDILKDYGRITKIDPYDGIVDIDTGNKVISLAYGASGE